MNTRQASIGLGLIFVVVLAVITAKQMSAEAMAVVIGVVCGVAAAIPTSVLLLVALSRHDRRRLEDFEQQARQAQRNYPPVVVIQGGMPQALPPGLRAGYWPGTTVGPLTKREFHVVGEDDLWLDERE
jgi:hypothetical protein